MTNSDQLCALAGPKITSLPRRSDEVQMLAMPTQTSAIQVANLDDARLSIVLIEPVAASLPDPRFLLCNDIYQLTCVRDNRELSLLRVAESFALALISDTLGRVELVDVTRSVRKQWPTARILVLGHAAVVLEDNLYDDALPHSCVQQDLCDTLTRMSSQRTHGRPFIVTTPASERDSLQRRQAVSADHSRLPDVPERMTQMRFTV